MARNAYDADLDKIVKTLGKHQDEGSRSEVVVHIRAYNGGEEKVAIQRADAESGKVWKLGRMTVTEGIAVGKLLSKMQAPKAPKKAPAKSKK